MLAGFIPCPEERARVYRQKGYWEGLSIFDMVARTAARHPDNIALVSGARRISYRELIDTAERLACRLDEGGLKPLDRVVMQLPNTPEFAFTYLALMRIGTIPVMALRTHRTSEVRHFINASGAVAYFVPDQHARFDYRPMAQTLSVECPTLKQVFVAGEPAQGQTALGPMIEQPLDGRHVRGMLEGVGPDPNDVATMLLSGGTTSISKLIPRTHNDYVLNARLCAAAAGMSSSSVFMAILPLGHNYNLSSPGMLGTFYHGGTVVLASSGDADEVFGLVQRERVSVIAAVVPLITGWLNSDAPSKYDLGSLRVIQNGGARLAPELRRRLRERFGCIPQEIYGTAEGLINMVRLGDPDELLLESSGAPVCEDDEIRVVDDAGNEVPEGGEGELVTRGPYTISGYYDAPEKNREAFTPDGFYRMGDIVRKRGRYVFAEGRKKDLINRGGEKISCEEVENLILRHPSVRAVSLVAMPDERFGEKACAFVIPHQGKTLAFEELTAFLRRQEIASFKLPERLELVSEFPVSPVGKILKRELRERIAAKIEAEKARTAGS